ncbi:hypothetical protein GCM10027346_18990 [Hymenobacter seoulensis]
MVGARPLKSRPLRLASRLQLKLKRLLQQQRLPQLLRLLLLPRFRLLLLPLRQEVNGAVPAPVRLLLLRLLLKHSPLALPWLRASRLLLRAA